MDKLVHCCLSISYVLIYLAEYGYSQHLKVDGVHVQWHCMGDMFLSMQNNYMFGIMQGITWHMNPLTLKVGVWEQSWKEMILATCKCTAWLYAYALLSFVGVESYFDPVEMPYLAPTVFVHQMCPSSWEKTCFSQRRFTWCFIVIWE